MILKTTPYKYAIERGLIPQHVYNFVARNSDVIIERTDKIYIDSEKLDERYSEVSSRKITTVSTDDLKAEIARRKKVARTQK